ncbi:hypothetical protein [uncultured Nostoc sp.]|uniref:hypothetical protein n=1 Tax=uncultured Nostoc sp. TaxID=340711 RepID=UPI0035CB5B87
MKKLAVILLAMGIVLANTQSFASKQKQDCEEITTTSPYDANEEKIECLLALKRLLTDKEVAFLIDNYYEPEELYRLKLISLKQKRNLEANRL